MKKVFVNVRVVSKLNVSESRLRSLMEKLFGTPYLYPKSDTYQKFIDAPRLFKVEECILPPLAHGVKRQKTVIFQLLNG